MQKEYMKKIKKIASTSDYPGIDFPMKTDDYELVEKRLQMNVNAFCFENSIYPIYISKNSNTQVSNVLLLINEEKSHYVFIKDLGELMYSKTKTNNQIKKFFVWFVYKISLLNKYFLIIKNNVY